MWPATGLHLFKSVKLSLLLPPHPYLCWALPDRYPGVLPPPAEGHSGVRRAEDGVLPEPPGGGQRHAVLSAV